MGKQSRRPAEQQNPTADGQDIRCSELQTQLRDLLKDGSMRLKGEKAFRQGNTQQCGQHHPWPPAPIGENAADSAPRQPAAPLRRGHKARNSRPGKHDPSQDPNTGAQPSLGVQWGDDG